MHDFLIAAMDRGVAVEFVYDDRPRIVEVHAVGKSTKGELVLRGYQIDGASSRPLPCWVLFRLDRIEDLEQTTITSRAPRDGYAMNDKQMSEILGQIILETEDV